MRLERSNFLPYFLNVITGNLIGKSGILMSKSEYFTYWYRDIEGGLTRKDTDCLINRYWL